MPKCDDRGRSGSSASDLWSLAYSSFSAHPDSVPYHEGAHVYVCEHPSLHFWAQPTTAINNWSSLTPCVYDHTVEAQSFLEVWILRRRLEGILETFNPELLSLQLFSLLFFERPTIALHFVVQLLSRLAYSFCQVPQKMKCYFLMTSYEKFPLINFFLCFKFIFKSA